MTTLQLDLFAPATDTRRLVDGLTCLRDAMPEAMDVVLHLAHWRPIEHRGVGLSGPWAYTIRLDGLRYERRQDWYGQAAQMRRIAWAELVEQLGDDPRRIDLIAWAESLPAPSWKELYRPHELWPNPEQWHPDYITGDHARPGWDARIAAWRTLQAICTDAIVRLNPAGGAR